MYNAFITLIGKKKNTNEYGDTVESISQKEVFASVKSVSMTETYAALTVGLKPEYIFVLADHYDYDGEEMVEYDSKIFRIHRTVQKENEIELVTVRDGNT